MPLLHIHDANHPQLAVFSRMTDAELRDPRQLVGLARAMGGADANELAQGIFIAESKNVIERAAAAGAAPFALLVEERWLEPSRPLIEDVLAAAPETPAFVADHALVRTITGFERMRGMLAAFLRPVPPSTRELLERARHVAVLDGISNHTNIGAAFRSAAALGVDAVLVTPGCHDPLYRRAARVSMGAVFQVPWTHVGELPEAVPLLHEHGFAVAALALADDALELHDARLREHRKLALVLGSEGYGLSPRSIAACDCAVRIPMDAGVDSLNVAAAGAVAFWELFKRPR